MSAVFNSAYVYVQDACGERYLNTYMNNDDEAIERQKKHCRWWINYMRHPRKARNGSWISGPVRPCTIVVELYNDNTQTDEGVRIPYKYNFDQD